MKRFALLAAVCGAIALSAVGDAMGNEIWIFDNRFPLGRPTNDLHIFFLAPDGIDREFTAYGVVLGPKGKVYNLIADWPVAGFVEFKDYPEPLVERMPFLRWPFPIHLKSLYCTHSSAPIDNGDYRVVIGLFDPNKPITKVEDAFQVYSNTFSVDD